MATVEIFLRRLFLATLLFCFSFPALAQLQPPGFRPIPLGAHALTNAKVVVKPGEILENATVLIRDGLIEKVGKDLPAPADARVWDMKGMTIYAGFIDPYLTTGAGKTPPAPAKAGNDLTSGRFYGVPGGELDPGTAGAGYGINLITPEKRMAESYAPDAKLLEKLHELGFTAANIVPEKGILRGSSAFVSLGNVDPNRSIIKADVFQHVAFNNEGGKEDAYPDSLMGIISVVRQTFFDAEHDAANQADYEKNPTRKRPEFNPALAALRPAQEHKMRVAFSPESSLMVDRSARIARELKLDFLLVSTGEEWRRPELAKATGMPFIVPINFPELSKMPTDDDWEQLSLDQLRAWDWAPENPAVLRQQGLEIALTTYGLADKKNFRKNLKAAVERGLSEQDALAALTTIPAKLCGLDKTLGSIEAGKSANLTIVEGNYFDTEGKVRSVWIDGQNYYVESEPAKKSDDDKKKDDKKKDDKAELAKKEALKKRVAHSPLEGRGVITNPPSILIHSATIWTSGTNGILTNASIYISEGKIQRIGVFQAEQATNMLVIDAAGKQITPGLIDCHSHSAIVGDVNEAGLPSTAMVRVGDVVNSETDHLREELAGGLTIANLLHGSANPIDGQNQVIKLRDGLAPEELKFEGAIPGIKFALGENVKQSNWGEKHVTRFPQTRMGVRTFIQNRFIAAQQYLKEWETFRNGDANGKPMVSPRRDLELETLGEIIQGKRLIHCHSYRADEILMLIRLMDDFGVKIGTFQHVLEGYKVADEIAKHGAGASTFADWWAYKFEVYDAIAFNGSLMRDRGVLVSFNSDSPDLSRRLNTEAAKAVKFGGTPEIEALKFVTINPAKQLHIDHKVGSLEVGKDADFAIWSGNPLDSSSSCLQTWIDGKKYFDHDVADARAVALQTEKNALIEKAKKILKSGDDAPEKADANGKKKFFKTALEHQYDGKIRHCLDSDHD